MDKNLIFLTFDPRLLTLDLDFWPSTSTFDPRPRLLTLDLDFRPSTYDYRPSTYDPRPSTLDHYPNSSIPLQMDELFNLREISLRKANDEWERIFLHAGKGFVQSNDTTMKIWVNLFLAGNFPPGFCDDFVYFAWRWTLYFVAYKYRDCQNISREIMKRRMY
jgi:hypothetical protein